MVYTRRQRRGKWQVAGKSLKVAGVVESCEGLRSRWILCSQNPPARIRAANCRFLPTFVLQGAAGCSASACEAACGKDFPPRGGRRAREPRRILARVLVKSRRPLAVTFLSGQRCPRPRGVWAGGGGCCVGNASQRCRSAPCVMFYGRPSIGHAARERPLGREPPASQRLRVMLMPSPALVPGQAHGAKGKPQR